MRTTANDPFRRARRGLTAFGVALALSAALASPSGVGAGATKEIRFATMAPRGSSFLRVFQAWGSSVEKATSGRVKLRIYGGGVAGDDRDVLRKVKAGQIDGGQFSSVAMGSMAREMLLTQVPGIARGPMELKAIRDGMQSRWIEELNTHGMSFMGWSDVGLGRIFSSQPILEPSDYKDVRPWVYREDPIEPMLMKIVGANPVALGLPEVFPALQTGMIDTLTVSAVAAVALQWFRHVDYMSSGNGMTLVGATMVRKDLVDALSPDDREALFESSEQAHALLNTQLAKEEARAVRSLNKRGVKEFDVSEHQAAWDHTYDELQQALVGRLYSAEALAMAKKLAASAH